MVQTPLPPQASYRYPPAQCDVSDQTSLEKYRTKRVEWLELLEGDPAHSIVTQMHELLRLDLAYRAINEARGYGTTNSPTSAQSLTVATVIDHGFIAATILAISRLTDDTSDVVSIHRLIRDLEKNCSLFTREIFVCFDGLPFDYKRSETDYWSKNQRQFGVATGLPTHGPQAFYTSKRMHQAFDRVCGTRPDHSARGALLNTGIFSRLRAYLESPEIKLIRNLRNKFVSHAADNGSRRKIGIDAFGITLGQISKAQRTLVKTFHIIQDDLLISVSNGIIPENDELSLQGLDRPFIPTDRLPDLEDWLKRQITEREKWARER